jgi:acyl-CoA synthetase (NDP forming)
MSIPNLLENVSNYLKDLKLDYKSSAKYLNEIEVYNILEMAGVDICDRCFLSIDSTDQERKSWSEQAAKIAEPNDALVLKIVGRDILHKSDVGGVKILSFSDVRDSDNLLSIVDQMTAATVGCEGVLAAEFVPHKSNIPGQELLVSIKQDSAFGPVVVLGVGGLLTEWYGEATQNRSRIIIPAENFDASYFRHAISNHPLFSIYHSKSRVHKVAPLDIEVIVDIVSKMAGLASMFSASSVSKAVLEEIEINPMVVAGGKAVAIDGVGCVSANKLSLQNKSVHKIANMMNPVSAVVLGVSASSMNPGRIIVNNLKQAESIDQSRLYIVHPVQQEIDAIPCLNSIAELPEKVDLAVVCVPADAAGQTISQLIESDKCESIILIPGGFAEAGHPELGAEIENMLSESHGRIDGGPVMVGGNCLGIVSRGKYNTFFLPSEKLPFSPADVGSNLAVISQSGAYLVTFASNYDGIINPEASISFGNQMDLTVSDLLDYYIKQENVNVIACYVEGFKQGDGARFIKSIAEARRQNKQVIVYKAGKTELGAKAAASHTASLAGDYDIASSCIVASGAIITSSLDEFEDMIKIHTMLSGKSINGSRVGIMSNAGFECSVVTDNLLQLELVEFDADVLQKVGESIPSYAHSQNPVDATPMANTEAYSSSVGAIINSDGIDCAIISSVPVTPALNNLPADHQSRLKEDLYADGSQGHEFIKIISKVDKPVVVVIDSGELYNPLAVMIEAAGIPVFRKIDRASKALASFVNSRLKSNPKG